jgi:hypothetical protein
MNKLALVSVSLVTLAGVAAAQNPPAKGAPAVPTAEKKAAPPADAAKKAPPADEKAAPPKPAEPAQELKDMAKGMAGTWKCTGQAEIMGQMIDVKATITNKVDPTLGAFWINTQFVGTAPKMPPMKSSWYTTYNSNDKKLYRVMMNSRGGVSMAWGTMADKKTTWEGESHWPDGTAAKMRATEEMTSPKEMHAMGEYSKDGGKTWSKDHDATCKK